MTQHQAKQIVRNFGIRTTTLCGRMNSNSRDGMNIAATTEEVTCKFCLKIMKKEKSA